MKLMSYTTDLIKAKVWWADIREKEPTDDVPDPIEPHPFPDAVQQVDELLSNSYCYQPAGVSFAVSVFSLTTTPHLNQNISTRSR